ncbi:LacI family DNA-binding transcriptional regulator [Kineococcus sp. TBRC 1896]|uniref:LacI family DNA-binding transcriptional regulator n=1 Tax=Kineococcus mangrovi TaxID=1660183 RepID=A0ABV4HZK4_9ACTN
MSPSGPHVPTMKDVALRAGVSRQLVSMVMRGVPGPSEASREKVLSAAQDLGFAVNTSARLLRQSRTRLIGVAFAAGNVFESRFVERFLERAEAEGFGVVLAPATSVRSTDVVVNELLGHRVEALACFNPAPGSPALDRALGLVPVVWLGERRADPRADEVRSDDGAGLLAAVEHLHGLGHRRITYVGGHGGAVGPDRAQAYRDAMTATGLTGEIDVVDSDFEEESAAQAARELLRRRVLPSAVVCCSDQCAAAVRAVLRDAGVAVPAQVSLVGYDDSPVAGLSFNDLTSVRQDVDLTVAATLGAIVRRLQNPTADPSADPTPATLVVRSSTGPARAPTRRTRR